MTINRNGSAHTRAISFGGASTFWATRCFARSWFEDAVAEAQRGDGFSGKRREILFAVCAAETYILEWTRDEALSGNYAELANYFGRHFKRPVRDKWKDVPRELERDGYLASRPNWCNDVWQNFRKLVDYRDGFVHASVSLPSGTAVAEDHQPFPRDEDVAAMKHGWPVNVVAALVEELHRAAGSSPPQWLVHVPESAG